VRLWQIARQVLQDPARSAIVIGGMTRSAWNVRVVLPMISCFVMMVGVLARHVARQIDPEHPFGVGTR
jgi:hypothetical protein